MNFIELFKEQFYFIGCDISRAIRNNKEVKIVTFPKAVLTKVLEQTNCDLSGTAPHTELRLRREYEETLVPSHTELRLRREYEETLVPSHAELRLRREYEGTLVPSLSDTNVNVSSWVDEYNAHASYTKCYAVLTGKISGITVLDFDTLYSYKTFCKNVPDFESYFTVKTKKGYHVYCLYNPELKSCNNVLKKLIPIIDIRNDPIITKCGFVLGHCVLCPPSSYTTLNGECYTYEFLGGTIKPIPEYLFECLKILKAENRSNQNHCLTFWPENRI